MATSQPRRLHESHVFIVMIIVNNSNDFGISKDAAIFATSLIQLPLNRSCIPSIQVVAGGILQVILHTLFYLHKIAHIGINCTHIMASITA